MQVGTFLRSLLGVLAFLISLRASAQGRIQFANDSLHLMYYRPCASGQAVSSTNMPPGVTLVADLYMGTSSSFLYLYTTATIGSNPGRWNNINLTADASTGAPAIPGGTQVYVAVQVRDAAYPPPTTFDGFQFGTPYGTSQEFTFVLGTSTLSFPPMTSTNAVSGGGFSTWAAGTFPMDAYGAGSKGAIEVGDLEDGPPSIGGAPRSQPAYLGTNVFLSGYSYTTASYQWQFNGTNIPWATSSQITLTNVQFPDAGSYRLIMTNNCGSVVTSNAIVQVIPTNGPSISISNVLAVGTVQSPTPAQVSIAGGFPSGSIYYTLDGSQPTTSSHIYTSAFSLSSNATITAMSVSSDHSQTATSPAVIVQLSSSYTKQLMSFGANFLANDLSNAAGNYVSNVLASLPDGDTVYKFDPVRQSFSPAPPSATVNPGEDFVIMNGGESPQLPFFGTRPEAQLPLNMDPGRFYLVGRRSGDLGTSSWADLVGSGPVNGSTLLRFDPAIQDFDSYSFHDGGWMNPPGAPQLAIGESALVVLQPSLVFSNAPNGQEFVIWSAPTNWILEAASDLNGPWTALTNATSPYPVGAGGESKNYYRLHGGISTEFMELIQ